MLLPAQDMWVYESKAAGADPGISKDGGTPLSEFLPPPPTPPPPPPPPTPIMEEMGHILYMVLTQ